MKLFKLIMLFLAGAFTISDAAGQANASINILTQNTGIVNLGGTVFLQVTVNNTGPASSIGIYKIRTQISVPSAIAGIPATGHTLPAGWTITSNDGSTIRLSNGTDVIAVNDARTILIAIQGNTIGGPSTVAGQLSFSNGNPPGTGPGILPGDNTADNSSTSTIEVVTANQLPVVSITNPLRDTNYIVPGPIVLNADASDPDGTITAVDFYNDVNTLLYTDSTAPYSFQWSPAPTGNYHFTAVATDNSGGKDTSASVHINILHNRPPVVRITSPADGAIFPASVSNIVFTADATAQGSVRTVDFYNGTLLMRSERKVPYKWDFISPSPGTYTITAIVTDSYGRSTTSAPVTVTVEAPAEPLAGNRLPSGIKGGLNNFISIKIAPNPVSNILNINTTGLQMGKQSTISLISASGAILKTVKTSGSLQTIQMNVSSLTSGMYVIKIMSGGKVMYRQFVKL